MNPPQQSLSRQLDLVFREVRHELKTLTGGTLIIQIRNDGIGKFGIRHLPYNRKPGSMTVRATPSGLTDAHLRAFRQMAEEALSRKNGWTHGEIQFDFALRQDTLEMSVTFESNYNMAHLLYAHTY